MNVSLRVILVLLGLFILAGVFWDIFRFRERRIQRKALNLKGPKQIKEPKWDNYLGKPSDADLDSEVTLESGLEPDPELELRADPEISVLEPTPSSALQQPLSDSTEPKLEEVVALVVMARQPGVFLGKKLLEAFNELDLYYGDLEIFHRHENTDGTGKTLFSVTSAIEPGFFDLAKMSTLVTPGLILFFTPEHRNQSIATFELMLRTAKLLAQRLDGELRDQDRRPLTSISIEKYRERVRRP